MRSKRFFLLSSIPVAAFLLWLIAGPSEESGMDTPWSASRTRDLEVAAGRPAPSILGSPREERALDLSPSGEADEAAPPPAIRHDRSAAATPARWEPAPSISAEEEFGRLDRLTARVVDQLYDGFETPSRVLSRIRSESDPDVVDALFAALQEASEFVDTDPAALGDWLDLARRGPDPAKRASAIRALGQVADPEGAVRSTLLEAARSDASEEARFAALGALLEYVEDKPASAEEVSRSVLAIARAPHEDPEIRAEALGVVDPYHLGSPAVAEVGRFLRDPAVEVRFVAAQVLGRSRARDRDDVLGHLADSYRSETDPDVRYVALRSIVEAGRQEGIPSLRSLAAGEKDPEVAATLGDYIWALDSGEVDTDRIDDLVAERQLERAPRDVSGANPRDPEPPHDHDLDG